MGKEKPVSLGPSLGFWAVIAALCDLLGTPGSVECEKRHTHTPTYTPPPPTPAKWFLFLFCGADEGEGEEKSGDDADKGVSNFVFISFSGKHGNI